jgi:TonB family protein
MKRVPTWTVAALGFAVVAGGACGGGGKPPASAPKGASEAAPGAGASDGGGVSATANAASAPVADATHVVADMKLDFRACYDKALAKDPSLEGAAIFVAKVDPQGNVTDVTVTRSTMPADLADCLRARIQRGKFTPPGPSGSTIQIPIVFKKGQD